MEKEIKIFENEEFGSVRTLKEEAGRVVFCGKDVAAALGYSNTKDAIKRHCRSRPTASAVSVQNYRNDIYS